MKTSLYVALAAFFATSEAFTVTITDSVRTSTELNQFRPTKWTPTYGATGSATSQRGPSYGAPPSYSAAPPSYSQGPAAAAPPAAAASASLSYGGMPKPIAGGGPKGNYSGVKWSPRGGAKPGFGGGVPASPAPVAAAAGPSLDALAAQWAAMNRDQDGVPPTPQMNYAAAKAPPPKPVVPAGPTMADLATQWAAMNRSN